MATSKLKVPILVEWEDIKAYMEMYDIVEVVRCKDCKYGHRLTDTNGYNYRTCNYPWGHGMMVDEHGFCKWGERREDYAEVH